MENEIEKIAKMETEKINEFPKEYDKFIEGLAKSLGENAEPKEMDIFKKNKPEEHENEIVGEDYEAKLVNVMMGSDKNKDEDKEKDKIFNENKEDFLKAFEESGEVGLKGAVMAAGYPVQHYDYFLDKIRSEKK